MTKNFYDRQRTYYQNVAAVLRGQADASAIFPNTTDNGMSRERLYAEFLRQHAPSKCNVFLGGFVFAEDGVESRPFDIIITTDTAPRFDFHNPDEDGKSFSPVEGTIGVVAVKSNLDKKELFDALEGFASIPATKPLAGRVMPPFTVKNYDDWPFKVIYALKGVAPETLLEHLKEFYRDHPDVPLCRRPHVIHVLDSYCMGRVTSSMVIYDSRTGSKSPYSEGDFLFVKQFPDLQGIALTLKELQIRTVASTHIIFDYGEMLNKLETFD